MRQTYHVELPYPEPERLRPDRCAAEMIAPAYAGGNSEPGAIFQYLYHHFHYAVLGMEKYSSVMEGIAVSEMKHFDLLGAAIIRLGVDPIYTSHPPGRCDYFNTSRIAYSKEPREMLSDDIRGERMAIAQYEAMICRLRNEEVAALIQRIVMDERLHVRILGELLEELDARSSSPR